MRSHPSALALVAERMANVIRPPTPVPVAQWMSENIVLVDGPEQGNLWNAKGAPYLTEIANCLSEDHPCNFVTVRKSQQTGASILALGWCLYVADREPANLLYAVPGIDALKEVNNGKLQPLITAWQKKIGRKVLESKQDEKEFAGGRLILANANSVLDLSSVTIKKGVRDELSKWTDIPGYGDPENLFFGRFTAFRRKKTFKILDISTPEIDTGDETGETEGHCRIDRRFKLSDRRFWHCLCPECGQLFVHRDEFLIVDEQHLHKSRYQCSCGHHISDAERIFAIDNGEWIPTYALGDHPGFHIDAFISKMMSYEAIAEEKRKAKTETGRKDYSNLVLGLAFRLRSDAPEVEKLMMRRVEWMKRGHIPPKGILLTAAADVQMRGIWLEIVAHGSNRETWLVDALYIDGDTANHRGEVFKRLRELTLDRKFPDAFGRERTIDALAIDTGYRANTVYGWVRENQRLHPDTGYELILATKGIPGWGKPAIGTPTLQDIDLGGRKIKQGAKLWGVGIWPLKADFYSFLRQEGMKAGAERDPDGYCHFGMWVDEVYFKQLTGDRLEDVKVKGRVAGKKWAQIKDNHFHDCRIYNVAMAEYLGMSSTTDEQWRDLALRRGLPDELSEPSLFGGSIAPVADTSNAPRTNDSDGTQQPANTRDPEPETDQPHGGEVYETWLGRDTSNWHR
ncbi:MULTISPECIES: terminase gpA endonuclease subunit [unclassified Bradyrhizobium]|uniref:terminase gpA endonuclease subunit n=1 Tax=unclassified Bradyrhizobium TaxID=2631580 RepID=UPI0028E3012A|nr:MULTISPECIES: terminase gpA endonuclease subunit [unclassified Bradyrhizobium]